MRIFQAWHLVAIGVSPLFPPILLIVAWDMLNSVQKKIESATPEFPAPRGLEHLPPDYVAELYRWRRANGIDW